jgi:hypothetical protein
MLIAPCNSVMPCHLRNPLWIIVFNFQPRRPSARDGRATRQSPARETASMRLIQRHTVSRCLPVRRADAGVGRRSTASRSHRGAAPGPRVGHRRQDTTHGPCATGCMTPLTGVTGMQVAGRCSVGRPALRRRHHPVGRARCGGRTVRLSRRLPAATVPAMRPRSRRTRRRSTGHLAHGE